MESVWAASRRRQRVATDRASMDKDERQRGSGCPCSGDLSMPRVGDDPVGQCAHRRPHDRSFAANARAPSFAPNRISLKWNLFGRLAGGASGSRPTARQWIKMSAKEGQGGSAFVKPAPLPPPAGSTPAMVKPAPPPPPPPPHPAGPTPATVKPALPPPLPHPAGPTPATVKPPPPPPHPAGPTPATVKPPPPPPPPHPAGPTPATVKPAPPPPPPHPAGPTPATVKPPPPPSARYAKTRRISHDGRRMPPGGAMLLDPLEPAGRRFANFVFAEFPVRSDDGARAIGANEPRGRRRQHP